MNRVIIHIASESPEAIVKRRRDRIKESLKYVEELSGGIVDVFVTFDGRPMFCIGQFDDCEGGIELTSIENASAIVAAELRTFSESCLIAAARLERGAV